jgi:pimeloyl-ACP methyl ester carboxylesterase
VEEVRRRHPDAPKPAVIGNCQGGWAAALVGAEKPDLVGPMVFNGSPLSYWGGVKGTHPIRYRGGLLGISANLRKCVRGSLFKEFSLQ